MVASGLGPLSYQWHFHGNALAGCTDSFLSLPSVQNLDVGVYTVTVTNVGGAATSAPASLNVILPVERRIVPGLKLFGQAGTLLNLEQRETLGGSMRWLPLETVTLDGPPQWYFDLSTPLVPHRFYRGWQTGQPGLAPSLNLPGLIPALTLTGSIGRQVRVDGINAVGPIDAWYTLNTVTLTNTSQLYFDVSTIGQPPRLWRIVQVP